ncbi:nuclear transport factor 2 family protein [Streptomyces tendae]
MSIERNKEIAQRLVKGFSADGDINAALALLREDAVWTVMGHPESFRLSGGMPKEQFIKHITDFRGSTPDGLRMIVTGVTAEGDRVARGRIDGHAEQRQCPQPGLPLPLRDQE